MSTLRQGTIKKTTKAKFCLLRVSRMIITFDIMLEDISLEFSES